MKNIDIKIRKAIEAIEQTDGLLQQKIINDVSMTFLPKQFNGYISSFGANIVMSGLLPAIIFNSQQGGAEAERGKMLDAIWYIIKDDYPGIPSLLSQVLNGNNSNDYLLRKRITEAAIALKLAIRIFPTDKNLPNA